MGERGEAAPEETDMQATSPDAPLDQTEAVPSLAYLLAGVMAAAGAIHLAMVPSHAGGELIDPIGFAVAGWFQLAIAGLILARRASPTLYAATIAGNAALLGLWAASRTVGLPVGSHAGVVEDVASIDAIAAGLQATAIALSVVLLWAPERVKLGPVPALLGVGALGLATVAIVSPDSAGHGTSTASGAGTTATAASSDGHGHSHGATAISADTAATDMALIDDLRCDLAFNPQGYWDEAAYLGVDTYAGGAMDTSHHATDASLATQVASPSVNGGRGSQALDELIVLTDGAGKGEAAAGRLVAELTNVTDEDYQAWLQWLRDSGATSHSHDEGAAPDDNGGHGGHVGPQPWKAMVDQSQCEQLEEELQVARDTALAYPTAADATEAGWVRVTPYVAGIAAHYMNFGLVDGTFEIDKPEMILYDGNGPEAHVVGLSYYILHEAEAEPTQDFTGDNDHYHRHVGLCVGAGGVIGDTTLTAEECAAIGGVKQDGGAGWMSHAWVVPGCESPWGVFSAASPILDNALAEASSSDDGGCAGSGVLDRYDLSPGRNNATTYVVGDEVQSAEGE